MMRHEWDAEYRPEHELNHLAHHPSDVWEPEVEVKAPAEDATVRTQLLGSQGATRMARRVDRAADWSDLTIDLPDVNFLPIGRALERDDVQALLTTLIGEGRASGTFRSSLTAALAVELDGIIDSDVHRNIIQTLSDSGWIQEESEEDWFGQRASIFSDWERDEEFYCYTKHLEDLLSLVNDPFFHVSKEVERSVLLDREGEERIGRSIFAAIYDACNAMASDDDVLSVLVDLRDQVNDKAFPVGRISRLEEDVREDSDIEIDFSETGENELKSDDGGARPFVSRLDEAILAYSDTAPSGRERRIARAIRRLELTASGLRAIQKRLALSGVPNESLDAALKRVTRLELEMFVANIRLAIAVAGKYGWSTLPRMDRIQEAYLGLLKAIDKFDFERGIKFSTYATWWLKQAVTRAIANEGRIIRLPVHVIERVRKIDRAARASGFDSARDIPISRLSTLTELSEAEVLKALVVLEDATLWEDAPDVLAVVMSLTDDGESPIAFSERLEAQKIVLECLDELSSREAEVVKHRFGLGEVDAKTLEEVGGLFQVTRERIRQIESKALKKLSKKSRLLAVFEH